MQFQLIAAIKETDSFHFTWTEYYQIPTCYWHVQIVSTPMFGSERKYKNYISKFVYIDCQTLVHIKSFLQSGIWNVDHVKIQQYFEI